MPSDILAQIEESKNALPQSQAGLAADIDGVLERARKSAEALSVVKALMGDIGKNGKVAANELERMVAGFEEYDAMVAKVAARTGALVAENGRLDDSYRQLGQNAPAAFGDANTAIERTLSLVGEVATEVQKMQTALVDATIASALEWIDYEKELARVRDTMLSIGTAAGNIRTPSPAPAGTGAPAARAGAAGEANATGAESAAATAEKAAKAAVDAVKEIAAKLGNAALTPEQHAQAMADARSLTGNFASQQSYLGFIRRAEGLANLKQTGTGDADLDAKVAKMTSDFDAALGRVANLQGSGADFEKIIARLSAAGGAGSDEDFESAMDKLGDVLHAEEETAVARKGLAAAIETLKQKDAAGANANLLKRLLAQNPTPGLATPREAEARQNAARYSVVATDATQTASVRAAAADKASQEKFVAETLSYYKKGTATPEELREIEAALDDFQNATDEDAKDAARQRIDQLTAIRENAGHGNELTLREGLAKKWHGQVENARDEFREFAGGDVKGFGRFAAGVAFAGKKLHDFAKSVEDAAKSLAENKIAATNSAAAFDKMAVTGEFETLRSSLNLTREQMVEFAGSVHEAVQKNGLSMDTVELAANRVKDAFGVFKPEAMREVMAVLEKLTDSQAQALMGGEGDREGALANLIAGGNAADALALYDKGLLGKQENIPTGAEGEKEMLRNVQSMERTLEEIYTSINGLTSKIQAYLLPISNFVGAAGNMISPVVQGMATLKGIAPEKMMGNFATKLSGMLSSTMGQSILGLGAIIAGAIATWKIYQKVSEKGQAKIEHYQELLAIKQAEGTATAQDIANVEAAQRAARWAKLGVWIGGAVGAIVGGLAGVLGGPLGVMAGAAAGMAGGALLGGFVGEKLAGGPADVSFTEEDKKNIQNRVREGKGVVSTGNDLLRNALEQAAATQALTEKLQALTRAEQNLIDTAGKLNTALANVGGSAAAMERGRRAMTEAAGSAHRKEMAALQERRSEILKSNLSEKERRQLLMQVDAQIAESTNRFAEALKNAAEAVTAFTSGLDYLQFGASGDAADALGRRAEMNMNSGAARRAAALQYTAVQGEYEIAKQHLKETLKNGPAALKKELDRIAKERAEATAQHQQGKLSDEDYQAKLGALNDQEQMAKAGSALERARAIQAVAEAELKFKEAIPKIAEREVAVKRQALKFAEDALSIQEDLMTTIGAPAEMLYQLEKDKVRLARQELRIEQEKLDSMIAKGAGAKDLKEQELEVARKQAAVVKAQYGAQNSILEKMLGALVGSFGEISGLGDINNLAAVLGMGYVDYKNGSYGRGNGDRRGGYRDSLFGFSANGGDVGGEGEESSEEDQEIEKLINQNVSDIHQLLKERLQKIKMPNLGKELSPLEAGIDNVAGALDDIINILDNWPKGQQGNGQEGGGGDRVGGALTGAAAGAVAGAAIGSVIPVIGTAVGAVIGGLAGAAIGYNVSGPSNPNAQSPAPGVPPPGAAPAGGSPGRQTAAQRREQMRKNRSGQQGVTFAAGTGAAEGGQIDAPYRTGDKNLIRVNDGEWVLNENQMEGLRKLLGLGSAEDVFRAAGGNLASNIQGFANGGQNRPRSRRLQELDQATAAGQAIVAQTNGSVQGAAASMNAAENNPLEWWRAVAGRRIQASQNPLKETARVAELQQQMESDLQRAAKMFAYNRSKANNDLTITDAYRNGWLANIDKWDKSFQTDLVHHYYGILSEKPKPPSDVIRIVSQWTANYDRMIQRNAQAMSRMSDEDKIRIQQQGLEYRIRELKKAIAAGADDERKQQLEAQLIKAEEALLNVDKKAKENGIPTSAERAQRVQQMMEEGHRRVMGQLGGPPAAAGASETPAAEPGAAASTGGGQAGQTEQPPQSPIQAGAAQTEAAGGNETTLASELAAAIAKMPPPPNESQDRKWIKGTPEYKAYRESPEFKRQVLERIKAYQQRTGKSLSFMSKTDMKALQNQLADAVAADEHRRVLEERVVNPIPPTEEELAIARGLKPAHFQLLARQYYAALRQRNHYRQHNPNESHLREERLMRAGGSVYPELVQERANDNRIAGARPPAGAIVDSNSWSDMNTPGWLERRRAEATNRLNTFMFRRPGSMPGYSNGGEVHAPYRTGDRNIIGVNDGEWVLNENQMGGVAAAVGADTPAQAFSAVAGGGAAGFAEAVDRAAEAVVRAIGGLEIPAAGNGGQQTVRVNIEVVDGNLRAAVKEIVTEPGLARRVVEEGSQSTYTDTGA